MHGVGYIVADIIKETTHLLEEESKSNTSTVHKTYNAYITYTPLSEKAANLYQSTPKYTGYLKRKANHTCFCLKNKKIIPWKKPGTNRFMTIKEAKNLRQKMLHNEKRKDKIILMTEGVQKLPPVPLFRVYYSYKDYLNPCKEDTCTKAFLFFTPCGWLSLPILLYKHFKKRNKEEYYGSDLNMTHFGKFD